MEMFPEPLFDATALEAAATQDESTPFRWLALSDDPEAAALRAVLEHGALFAGERVDALRMGLRTERWGQHVGAMAQLVTLGLFADDGFDVSCDPAFGAKSPDLLAERDGARVLVEVRSISGKGNRPWEEREAEGRGLQPEEREALGGVITRVIEAKASTYRELVGELDVPYLIVLYQDADTTLAPIARDVLYGRSDGDRGDARRSDRGVLATRTDELSHVSAVAVIGRHFDDDTGELTFDGELLLNPFARAPLPLEAEPSPLAVYRPVSGIMRWDRETSAPFTPGA